MFKLDRNDFSQDFYENVIYQLKNSIFKASKNLFLLVYFDRNTILLRIVIFTGFKNIISTLTYDNSNENLERNEYPYPSYFENRSPDMDCIRLPTVLDFYRPKNFSFYSNIART